MRPIEQWIWFPRSLYPDHQTSACSQLASVPTEKHHYAMASVSRTYKTDRSIHKVQLRFSGDTFFALFCNDIHIASGPASAGGDFLDGYCEKPLPNYYATEVTLTSDQFPSLLDGRLDFYAQVRMTPARLFDCSKGQGGFFLTAFVRFEDGTEDLFLTDESWQICLLSAYTAPGNFDNRIAAHKPVFAERITNIWNCETSPLMPCIENALLLKNDQLCEPDTVYPIRNAACCQPDCSTPGPTGFDLVIPAKSTLTVEVPFDKIYAGYLAASAKTSGLLTVNVFCRELTEKGSSEHYVFAKDDHYRGLEMHSAGNLLIDAANDGEEDALLHMEYIISYYPVFQTAQTVTDDADLNLVFDVCRHTLKQCRQTLHLDSPRHCEPLACTGDYYIESLMTAFTFGDQTLSAFDIRRTAELLRYRDGRMFHTTYSLIWVQMLWDVYRFTGETALLADCEDALIQLLNRFSTYIGENGIIDNPPDYMFIDWLYPDGINMHHPPKALGQTCLNMFYYGALKTAVRIFEELGEAAMAAAQNAKLELLAPAMKALLYDPERGLFFEGLNTPTPEDKLYQYMPPNIEKRYYRKHANILAAYFGFFDRAECARLLTQVMEDDSLGEVQPYFTHFLLEAIYRNGLRNTYTLPILEQWKAPVRDCSKGLAEGFYKPDDYVFDHSHAWGGTPAYSLPLALSGLEITEPGFQKIRLDPSLLGLTSAQVQIPTPFGMIELNLTQGQKAQIHIPDGITLEV